MKIGVTIIKHTIISVSFYLCVGFDCTVVTFVFVVGVAMLFHL